MIDPLAACSVWYFFNEKVSNKIAPINWNWRWFCQSGLWSKQPVASAYTDTFDTSDFNSGPNLCSGADLPQRSYLLNLTKRSLVFLCEKYRKVLIY